MLKIKCKLCGKKVKAKRRTKEFCSDTCRSNAHQKKNRRIETQARLEKAFKTYKRELKQKQIQLAALQKELLPLQSELELKQGELAEVRRLLSLDDIGLSREKEVRQAYQAAALPLS